MRVQKSYDLSAVGIVSPSPRGADETSLDMYPFAYVRARDFGKVVQPYRLIAEPGQGYCVHPCGQKRAQGLEITAEWTDLHKSSLHVERCYHDHNLRLVRDHLEVPAQG